jgi:hypothetical protein
MSKYGKHNLVRFSDTFFNLCKWHNENYLKYTNEENVNINELISLIKTLLDHESDNSTACKKPQRNDRNIVMRTLLNSLHALLIRVLK